MKNKATILLIIILIVAIIAGAFIAIKNLGSDGTNTDGSTGSPTESTEPGGTDSGPDGTESNPGGTTGDDTTKDPTGDDSTIPGTETTEPDTGTTGPSDEEACAHMWSQTESEATKAEYDAYLATIGKTDEVPVDEGYIAKYYRITRSCSHCNETETRVERRDEVDPNYKPDSGETPTDPIPEPDEGDKECEHTYETKTTAPTCTAKGYTEYTCSKCGKSYTSDYTNATGHSWSSWSTKAATCTTDGSKTRSCANCKKVESEVIKATGHSYGSWTTSKKATCESDGEQVRKCSGCGKTETKSIAATGHAWDEGKVTVKPTTCSDMGVITYTCKNCGKTKVSQVKGEHSFGAWTYEEYTYKNEAGASRPSHRKVRICEKCGYKEYGNTPDHYCAKGSANHTVTTVKAGTCTTKATMRSTCKVCGWYVDYDGKMGSHTITSKKVHLSDYTQYTNELDATIDTCTSCGLESVIYHYGKGYNEYYRFRQSIIFDVGSAYAGELPMSDDMRWVEHPEWQTVTRDHVYDSEGYVKQFTVYWWYNGQRYSQVIKCDPASWEAWFAEFGMTGYDASKVKFYQLQLYGTFVRPYKINFYA